jgi:hypothetical protein
MIFKAKDWSRSPKERNGAKEAQGLSLAGFQQALWNKKNPKYAFSLHACIPPPHLAWQDKLQREKPNL